MIRSPEDRRWTGLLALLLLVGAQGCRPAPPSEGEHPEPHGHEGRGPEGEGHEDGGHEDGGHEEKTSFRVPADRLRDLRLIVVAAKGPSETEEVSALGEIRVDEGRYAESGSPVAGHITRVLVGEGQEVKEGQPLVELRSVELGQARGTFLAATARRGAAERRAQRRQPLVVEGALSAADEQESQFALEQAIADEMAALASLRALGASPTGSSPPTDPSLLVIRSPCRGRVLFRDAVVGQRVEPPQVLFRIGDLSQVWMVAQTFEREALRVQKGGTARVTLPALPGQTFAGEVELLGSMVDVSARTLPVRVVLPNPDSLLRPGMSATAWLPVSGSGVPSVVRVPASSLQRLGAEWCVFLPQGSGAFSFRVVGRGRDLGGEVELLSGLKPGEKVIAEGAFLLKAEWEKAQGGGGDGHHH